MQLTQLRTLRLRFDQNRSGAASVEMAIVAPLFFLLILGLVEFTRMGMVKQALTDAARAGCRKAVLVGTITSSDAEAIIRSHMSASIASANDASRCRVSFNPSQLEGMESGTTVTTTVEVNYSDVSWIVPQFLSSTVLRGQATMKRE
jgi:Flp pilus assembly protein TadG